MYIPKLLTIAAVATAVTVSACDRGPEEAAQPDTTAADQQRQQEEAGQLEQRLNELEREWNEAQQRVSQRSAEARQDVQASLKELREEVGELKTTNAGNWWERHEREMDEAANQVEQDVRRFARRWTPSEPDAAGTTGDGATWESRRDRLIARLESRIAQMEEALTTNDVSEADKEEVEDTRARLRALREDSDRLRNASENDWWEVTRERVNDAIDRIEAAIRRLDDGAERPRS